ncbi:MAG: hypothetical protein HOE90_24580 [Bacteriovoracaceae bacterium]|nr:hypothetical protein [Bacteriovoracaceae bacterium]
MTGCEMFNALFYCHLDLGSSFSIFPEEIVGNIKKKISQKEHEKLFKVLPKKVKIKSVFQKTIELDSIEIPYVKVDDLKFKKAQFLVKPNKVLSLITLGNHYFLDKTLALDFSKGQLKIHNQRIPKSSKLHIFPARNGQIAIPITVGDKKVKLAFFDTGFSKSMIDEEFYRKNKALFATGRTWVSPTKTTDATGATDYESNVFVTLKKIKIGNVSFNNFQFLAGRVKNFTKKTFKVDVPIVIGADLISKQNWVLDFKNLRWMNYK